MDAGTPSGHEKQRPKERNAGTVAHSVAPAENRYRKKWISIP